MKKYVIIGNGTAAAGCIEGIRSVDKECEITVISAEKYPVYCRPLISYYLEGKTDIERMKYRSGDFYEKNDCKVLYGREAKRIDAKNKKITLDGGETIEYDALCNATGSAPFVPPMEGLDGVKHKFTFMTLDDSLALEKAIKPTSKVLIIGAGLIGLKCAEGLHGRVGSITVCDLADRVLSSILDEESATVVQKHLESNGISFMLGDSAAKFDGSTAEMKSGAKVKFDILVLAVGVRANTSLVSEAGGTCTRGILVDERMKTTVKDVYAAGDCTESTDISDGSVKVMALMPNAYIQGHCAGVNMAGGSEVFDNAVPMNSIGFFGLHIMTAGSRTDEANGGSLFDESTGESIKKLFVKNDKLIGFVLVGNVERAGIYTSLIRSQKPLSSINFDFLRKNPNLFSFSTNYRRKNLGSVV